MDWAENTKKLREKLVISQTELAEMLGISFASINRYETGRNIPTIKIKRKLKELYIKHKIIREE